MLLDQLDDAQKYRRHLLCLQVVLVLEPKCVHGELAVVVGLAVELGERFEADDVASSGGHGAIETAARFAALTKRPTFE